MRIFEEIFDSFGLDIYLKVDSRDNRNAKKLSYDLSYQDYPSCTDTKKLCGRRF